MKPTALILALSCGLAVSGCGSPDTASDTTVNPPAKPMRNKMAPEKPAEDSSQNGDLVGKWSVEELSTGPLKATYQFDKDGTGSFTLTGPSENKNGTSTIQSKDHYKLDGDKLSIMMDSIDATSTDPKQEKDFEAQKPQREEMVKSHKADAEGTIKWKDKDTAEFTIADTSGTSKTETLKVDPVSRLERS